MLFFSRERFRAVTQQVCAGALLVVATAVTPARAASEEPLPEKIRFNRYIRPVLSENCFKCHGFDSKERKAELRLDDKEGLTKKLKEGGQPISPGHPDQSEVWRRIITDDKSDLMPPPKSGKVVTARQKALIKKWIEQGMDYEPHWAFIAPERPQIPEYFLQVGQQPLPGEWTPARWVRNPIDHFVMDRLLKAHLKPAPEADKATLIRRVTLDLTGLPPTLAEVDAFVADNTPDAYEKLVDRLMSKVQYGERMAVDWLDAARYADTHGYHIDSGRDMARWREWVIDAFAKNKPYDAFVTEQLAGDLLPNPTLDQKIATGFQRNHMINFEGGADPNEYHFAYLLDRTNTAGTVFLGLSVACSQCHDHKYDPITQKDFYSLFAFFNNVPENGLDGNRGNAMPFLKTPTDNQQEKLDLIAAGIKSIQEKLSGPNPQLDEQQLAWEASFSKSADDKVVWAALDPQSMKSAGGATLKRLDDKSILASGVNPATETYTMILPTTGLKSITAIKLEVLPDPSFPANGPGRSANGNMVMTDIRLGIGKAGEASAAPRKFKAASADYSQDLYPVAHAIDDKPQTGWAIYPQVNKTHEAVFELESPITPNGDEQLTLTLIFGSQFGQHQAGHFRLWATDAKQPHGASGTPANITAALGTPSDKRSAQQKSELKTYYRTQVSTETRKLNDEVAKLKKEQGEVEAKVPTSMVMQEMPSPRDTFVRVRGAFDKNGEKVSANTPSFLPPMKPEWPKNRLGLAKWLTDASNPLMTRVTVNRYWQMFFGTGLVKTVDDFGSQGELPSNPELLDWLAVELRDPSRGAAHPWDLNHIVRLIVTSSTYRQSSAASPQLITHDPENRLFARGPRFRLQAEFIRDQALAVSNLLDARIGGASVFPYQPAGLWEELMSRSDGANWSAQTYTPSKGADLYRRTMYTFWKRTSPPPTLSTFDAPDRETCTVRRARTNTPLQALVLMNDPTYVEASRKLAERMMKETGAATDDKVAFAFRLVTARKPNAQEAAVLKRIFDQQLKAYSADLDSAKKLLAVGESPRDEKLAVSELAAWTTVASVILNLDEAVTRN